MGAKRQNWTKHIPIYLRDAFPRFLMSRHEPCHPLTTSAWKLFLTENCICCPELWSVCNRMWSWLRSALKEPTDPGMKDWSSTSFIHRYFFCLLIVSAFGITLFFFFAKISFFIKRGVSFQTLGCRFVLEVRIELWTRLHCCVFLVYRHVPQQTFLSSVRNVGSALCLRGPWRLSDYVI